MRRYLTDQIVKDLSKKMVFLAGPRQVGKTTLAREIIPNIDSYLNWDISSHREQILEQNLPNTQEIIFDEIHKYKGWRRYLKGIYDDPKREYKILVTGSAKLDYYRYGGDSLQGRYHYLRLHPLSFKELGGESTKDLKNLLELGGFPEPFFSQSEVAAKRWSSEYRSRLIEEDLSSLETVEDIGALELLMLRLPKLVASPLSINGLREDLQKSHKTVSRWLQILERLYAIFRLSPTLSPKIQAVKKEQKHYHFDWSLVQDKGARFENLVACHLLKYVHHQNDTQGINLELRYLRDTDKKEVDFVIIEDNKPTKLIEVKYKQETLSPALKYFHARIPNIVSTQISLEGEKDYITKEGIRICPAHLFLRDLV